MAGEFSPLSPPILPIFLMPKNQVRFPCYLLSTPLIVSAGCARISGKIRVAIWHSNGDKGFGVFPVSLLGKTRYTFFAQFVRRFETSKFKERSEIYPIGLSDIGGK